MSSLRSWRGIKIFALFLCLSLPYTTSANSFDYDQGFYDQTHEMNLVEYQEEFGESGWDGAFNFSFPIEIPPGRGGLAPELELVYNNQNTNQASFYGHGWSLEIPWISRLNVTGVDKLYTDNYFVSSLTGELRDVSLIDDVHGEYGSKVDNGEFLIYGYDVNGYWTVTDKEGTVFTFGESVDSRQTDPNDSDVVYKWMLSEIRDTNDNYIAYEYTKDGGQIYPSSITYTGHDAIDGIFSVDFSLESRSDTMKTYNTGFEVQTDYRVNNITASVNGDWARQYELTYTTGHNGSRSLLESVTESAQNDAGEVVTLPATEFAYEAATESWTEGVNYSIPEYFYMNGDNDYKGVDIGDFNADGLMDIIDSANYGNGNYGSWVYINDGDDTGWTEDVNYNVPVYFWETSGNMMKNVRIADVNADTYPDLIEATSSGDGGAIYDSVYINNGDDTGWVEDTNYIIPTYFNNGYMEPKGVRVFDVNGDGLPDLVHSEYNHNHGTMKEVYINNGDGSGWTEDTNYDIPVLFYDNGNNNYKGIEIADVNADGLIDLIDSGNYGNGNDEESVYINNGDGTGWTEDINYNIPVFFWEDSGNMMKNVRVADVNGDGYPDLLESTSSGNGGAIYNAVYINNGDGTGWTEDSDYEIPVYFNGGYLQDKGARIADVDGDGMPDFIQSLSDNGITQSVHINDSDKVDTLTSIDHSKGARTDISYDHSDDLPFVLQTVSEITVDDGLGMETTSTYEYEDAEYYYADEYDHRFAGFEIITKTENQERVTKTYYHQGDDDPSKIGKLYRTEIYDYSDNLYRVELDAWENYDLGNDNDFVYKSQNVTMDYDGQADHVDKAFTYTYDYSNGNLLEIVDYDDVVSDDDGLFVDIEASDNSTTTVTYAVDGDDEIRAMIATETITNDDGDQIAEANYYYDDLNLGSVELGNLTSKADWLDVDNSYLITEYTVNDYGLVESITNPLSYTTSYAYDADYLYPNTVTNELGHVTSYEYDYASGQVSSETTPNTLVIEYTYDGLGRMLSKTVDGTGFLDITYDDAGVPSSLSSVISVNGVDVEERVYYDGLGRTIQAWQSAENSSFNIIDYWHNELGNLESMSLPYNSVLTYYNDRDANAEAWDYTHDVLGRVTGETSPLGTTTHDYYHRAETVTDANGNDVVFTYDTRSQLEQVNETNDGFTYTTSYEYDLLGNLTDVTDSQDNIRTFTYDSLSRKILQEDIHDPVDVDFATWTYEHDDNGNLIGQDNPNGETLTWQYDELDRVLDENGAYAYTYDIAQNGVGFLSSITSPDYSLDLGYDILGNVSSEQITILGELFETGYGYDVLNRLESIVHPSGNESQYTYNETGQVESVSFNNVDVVTNIDYSEFGQWENMYYANGDVETNYYDPTQNHLLTEKQSTNAAGTQLQDIQYAYDSIGSITDIDDTSETLTAKNVVYTYDDLNRLESSIAQDVYGNDLYEREYQYDEVGNLVHKSDIGDMLYEQTGNANPHAVTSAGVNAYEYDEHGNLTTDGSSSFEFNYRDEMTSSDDGNEVLSFYYDSSGARLAKTDDQGDAVYYVNPYYESGVTNGETVTRDYILVNGKKVFENQTSVESAFEFQSGEEYFLQPAYNNWQWVVYDEAFDPGTEIIVFAQVQSEEGSHAVRVDIRNIQDNGFQMRMEEDLGMNQGWLDGWHKHEYVSWVAFDKNNLPEGVYADVEYIRQNANQGISENVVFDQAFDPGTEPIVYAQTQSNRGSHTVNVDILSADESSFEMELQEDTGNGTPDDWDGWHKHEYVAWIAFDPADNPFGEGPAGSVDVGGSWEWVSLGEVLPEVPILFAMAVTENESDVMIADLRGVDESSFQIRLNELMLAGWDGAHIDEAVRYFTVTDNGGDQYVTSQYYYHHDHLGGPSIITDESGDIVQTLDYYPFGGQYIDDQAGDYETRYHFTGKELDENELHYFDARYYDSEIGRFMSQDPILFEIMIDSNMIYNPQRLNSYSYALNNPVNYIDPTGEKPILNIVGSALKSTFGMVVGTALFGTGVIFEDKTEVIAPLIGIAQEVIIGEGAGYDFIDSREEDINAFKIGGGELILESAEGLGEDIGDAWDWAWSDEKEWLDPSSIPGFEDNSEARRDLEIRNDVTEDLFGW